MIQFIQGDIFDSNAQALVNPVNCVGVMGAGLALEVKKRFPNVNDWYEYGCKHNTVQTGDVFTVNTTLPQPQYIINFPTKNHWRDKSRIEDIKNGLIALTADIRELEIDSIAIPALGCGLGGLQWEDVKPLIVAAFEELPDVDVEIYEPRVGGA